MGRSLRTPPGSCSITIMEQLLLHLFGDYILQTDWMANNKRKNWSVAYLHAVVYTIPFMLFYGLSYRNHPWAAIVIMLSHWIIDWKGLARYVVFAKNWVTCPSLKWSECSQTGYPPETPTFLSVWLLIIADNTLHLCINYLSLQQF